MTNFEFVKKQFIFNQSKRDDFEYAKFINDVTSYVSGGINQHRKDAIDVCCLAAMTLKMKFAKALFG